MEDFFPVYFNSYFYKLILCLVGGRYGERESGGGEGESIV